MSVRINFVVLSAVMTCVLCAVAVSGIVIPVDPGDALGCRDWGNGFSASSWVTGQDALTLTGDYDPSDSWYRYWYVPVLPFSISPLAGSTDLDATLNVYFESVAGEVQIRYGSDGDGVVEAKDWLNYGQTIVSIPGGTTGWAQIDVSDALQTLVDQDATWAMFTVRSADWWTGATVRASEFDGSGAFLAVVPEPTTIALVGLGAVGAFRSRRRRS